MRCRGFVRGRPTRRIRDRASRRVRVVAMEVRNNPSPMRPCRPPGREPISGHVGQGRDLRDLLDPEFACTGQRFGELARFDADAAGDFAVVDSGHSDRIADAAKQRVLPFFCTFARLNHHFSLHKGCDYGKSYLGIG